jgi:hypothetical protein
VALSELDKPDIQPDESMSACDECGPGLKLRYGRFVLSIVAGPRRYCTPRQYLTNISRYTAVEIALFDMAQIDSFHQRGDYTSPKALGINDEPFDSWFVSGDVEGWVSWESVYRLCLALKAAYGGTDDTWTINQFGERVHMLTEDV